MAGIAETQQFRSINEAAQVVEPGDTVLIHNGIYREFVHIARSGTPDAPIEFRPADPIPHVVVTGADVLSNWTKEPGGPDENVFSTTWGYVFLRGPTHAHPDDDFHKLIGRSEQVFVLGYPLNQVLERNQLSRGTFFVNEGEKRLYIWERDNRDLSHDGVTIAASARPVIWLCDGAHVRVRGIRFLYAANAAQQGAAQFKGKGDVIEDCSFDQTNACGAAFLGEDIVVRRCSFADNGQLGFAAHHAHRLLFTDCVVRNNNIKGWNRGWEAGGDKIVLSRDAIIEKSVFEENKGNAIWFDIGNENCTVRNCLITNNQDAGIFCEISYGLHAYDNVIKDNGFSEHFGAWGAQAGICLSSSPGCIVERNLIIGNREGFNFREQNRSTATIDSATEISIWNHDEVIRNNVLAYNLVAQTWGWFDISDERHWPIAMQQKASSMPGLSLEKLNIQFSNNLYCTEGAQKLIVWGAGWRHHVAFATLDEVRLQLGFENGSQLGQIIFSDSLTEDFRVPAESAAQKMGCYPKGEVPGVRLGIIEAR
jgi:hypothetical protein